MTRLHHVCFEVADLEQAAGGLAATYGAGPFFQFERRPFDELELPGGEAATLDHVIAFGLVLGQMVELKRSLAIEPPRLAAGLSQRPVHHIAVAVDDLDAECARLEALGAEPLVRARTGAFRLAYHRLADTGVIETLQDGPALAGLDAAVAAETARWDGTRPLRTDRPSAD
jgi:catechol 2,3-dioxygenase-like lactoylglutathione lyase family enzyme